MVGGHIESPEIFLDLKPFTLGRTDKAGYAPCPTVASASTGEAKIMSRHMQPGIPNLGTVDPPAVAVTDCPRLHPRRIRTVIWLSQAKGDAHRTVQDSGNKVIFLLVGAEISKHQYGRQITYD